MSLFDKKRNRELTQEEALYEARAELRRYWSASEPLFAGIQNEKGATVFPLQKEFSQKSYLIHCFDPFTLAGEASSSAFQILSDRFQTLGVDFINVIQFKQPSLFQLIKISEYRERMGYSYPMVLDHNELITRGFGFDFIPAVTLVVKGEQIVRSLKPYSPDTNAVFETSVQQNIRVRDPGLSFFPPYIPAKPFRKMKTTHQFGQQIARNYVHLDKRPIDGLQPDIAYALGTVATETDHLKIQSPHTQIVISGDFDGISVLAKTGGENKAEIEVILNDQPPREACFDVDLKRTYEGNIKASVERARIYHLLRALDSRKHEVILQFPNSKETPVLIFGMETHQRAPK